jgi:hypothetical protein
MKLLETLIILPHTNIPDAILENWNYYTWLYRYGSQVPKVGTIIVAIDNHMTNIQVQIGKNTIEDVLLDGGSRINFITE